MRPDAARAQRTRDGKRKASGAMGRLGRPRVLFALAVILSFASPAAAEGGEIPAGVLAQLLSKVPAYDHGFRERAGKVVQVLILTNPDEPESVRAAALMQSALLRESSIAGLPQQSHIYAFQNAEALAVEVKRRQVTIVYVTSGFSHTLDVVCRALEPLGVLTMTTVSEYVERCVVVGFQLLAGRPKILVHLKHAQRSGVRFRSELLELAKVYR